MKQAFTLMELLIAVAIFGVVLAAMNSVFYGAIRLRQKTEAAIEENLPPQQALAMIRRDLEGLVLPGGAISGQLKIQSATSGIGMQSLAEFYTSSGRIDDTSPWAEVQKVSYTLVDPTNLVAGKDLVRLVTRNLLAPIQDQPTSQWLMNGVERISFLFHDGSSWLDSWDSTTATNLPKAIKVQLEMAAVTNFNLLRQPMEMVIPVLLQARTNQTQTATGGGS